MSRQRQRREPDYWDARLGAAAPTGSVRLARRRSLWAGRLVAVLASAAVHLGILVALLLAPSEPPKVYDDNTIQMAFIDTPRPTEEPAAASPAPPAPPKPPPVKKVVKPKPVRTTVAPVVAAVDQKAEQEDAEEAVPELSDAQLAGARTAGTGSGTGNGGSGGECNMVQFLQRQLRKDPQVQAAVARAHAFGGGSRKAIHVWNGNWLRDPSQQGNGLAGVREAIMIEIAFAPEACKADPVSGLVLLSLNDGPGSARLAMGPGQWRWSDLLRHR